MNTKPIGWAPANPWFASGFMQRQKIEMEDIAIHVMPLSCFLTSKFEAYHNRGAKDPRTSHDFEDIVYILDNCLDIINLIIHSQPDVIQYLKTQFEALLSDEINQEAIMGNLPYDHRDYRIKRITDNLKSLIQRM